MNCYTKALHLPSVVEQAGLYARRGMCELQLGKYDLAREDAEDAIEREPNKVGHHHLLSEALLRLDLISEAAAACREGLRVDPRDPVLLQRQRDCGAIQGQHVADKNPQTVLPALSVCIEKVTAESTVLTLKPEDVFIVTHETFEEYWRAYLERNRVMIKAHTLRDGSKDRGEGLKLAVRAYEEAAHIGSAEGMYNLAILYEKGQGGLVRDFARKLEYLGRAIAQKPFVELAGSSKVFANIGVAEAENAMGVSYREGAGVDVELKVAASWFLKSAEHGYAGGQNNVGCALKSW
jgi:TPR repeat protein